MELTYKCSCGANHGVRLHDECRYCAKPISKLDWCKANLTRDDLRALLATGALLKEESNGQTQTETSRPSGMVVEKRTTKRMRESVVD